MTTSKKIGIVSYEMGNVDSVHRALLACGADPVMVGHPAELDQVEAVVLPGVGSFTRGMEMLRKSGLVEGLTKAVLIQKKPFLGICLGMQLLATKGIEGGETSGLGWIPGSVLKLKPVTNEVIPHMGWNTVLHTRPSNLLATIPEGKDFYFVHSYHFIPDDPNVVVATVDFCGSTVAAVELGTIFGVQFHPEKSQKIGFDVLKRFIAC